MFKLASVEFPLFGKFDLVLLRRRTPSVPPTIETAEPTPAQRPLAKCIHATGVTISDNVIPLRRAG